MTLIFDKRVILARKLFFNYGGNDTPISLGKTRANHLLPGNIAFTCRITERRAA